MTLSNWIFTSCQPYRVVSGRTYTVIIPDFPGKEQSGVREEGSRKEKCLCVCVCEGGGGF